VFAQTAAPDREPAELQTPLLEMRSQFEKMQRRMDELESSRRGLNDRPSETSSQTWKRRTRGIERR
jgi:hypothetical protein